MKYLESSQGAGQLIAQLDLQVLSLKPTNTDTHVYNRFQSEYESIHILPPAVVTTGKDKHECMTHLSP